MYKTTMKCGINGIEYEAGVLIDEKDIHPGSLPSALALGLIIKEPDPPVTDPANDQPTKKTK
ncbi:MAG: hypothetical protein WCH39_01595 [Schlesneria sp.]